MNEALRGAILGVVCQLLCVAGLTTAASACAASPESTSGLRGEHTESITGRSIELAGAPNFRDIGGYHTRDGHRVKLGTVYRSNALDKLTPTDQTQLAALHISTVVDLRTEEERRRAPSLWIIAPPQVMQSPKTSLAPLLDGILAGNPNSIDLQARMKSFYQQLPNLYQNEYAGFLKAIAAGQLPLLVHCTAGKDRTGVAIAILLSTLGVPRNEVLQDYTRTDVYLPPEALSKSIDAQSTLSPLARLSAESRMVILRADREYVVAALDTLARRYGSIDGYLQRGLGLTAIEERRLRRAMLERSF